MAGLRHFELEELVTRPGTYFNPATEVVLIIDDSANVDLELLGDDADGEDWILLGDDAAVDEHRRDELVEAFETRIARTSSTDDPNEDIVEEEDELEPDPDQDDGY